MAYEGPQSGDIRATLALSQSEAQNGSSRTLTLPGGRQITVPVRAGIQNGEQIRLKGMGEPSWSGGPAGDLVLTVAIAPAEQFGSQPNFIDDPSSPTDFISASSLPPTLASTNYPGTYPPPGSTPGYNEYGQYGSPTTNYPPSGTDGSYPGYQDPTQAQGPLYLHQNQAQYSEAPPYGAYPQGGQQYAPPPSAPKKRGMSPIVISLLVVLVLILIVGSGLLYFIGVYQPQKIHADATATANAKLSSTAQANAQATSNAQATTTAQSKATAAAQASATANASATVTAYQNLLSQATSGTPVLNDPLNAQSSSNWDVLSASNSTQSGSCAFTGGVYQSSMPTKGFFQPCYAQHPTFSNFAYQVQMTINQGDEGGILFRADIANSKFYLLRITEAGAYDLFVYVDNQGGHAKNLLSNSTSVFKQGLNQNNTITVIAQGGNVYFYINGQYVDNINNATLSSGKIGVFSESNTNSTIASFTNAKVWQL